MDGENARRVILNVKYNLLRYHNHAHTVYIDVLITRWSIIFGVYKTLLFHKDTLPAWHISLGTVYGVI